MARRRQNGSREVGGKTAISEIRECKVPTRLACRDEDKILRSIAARCTVLVRVQANCYATSVRPCKLKQKIYIRTVIRHRDIDEIFSSKIVSVGVKWTIAGGIS
jgi:hypothetical protein